VTQWDESPQGIVMVITLLTPVEDLNFDKVYENPRCHAVPKAFCSVQESHIDILVIKLKVTWSVSLVH
jgi:hypothetical protein